MPEPIYPQTEEEWMRAAQIAKRRELMRRAQEAELGGLATLVAPNGVEQEQVQVSKSPDGNMVEMNRRRFMQAKLRRKRKQDKRFEDLIKSKQPSVDSLAPDEIMMRINKMFEPSSGKVEYGIAAANAAEGVFEPFGWAHESVRKELNLPAPAVGINVNKLDPIERQLWERMKIGPGAFDIK